MSIVVSKSAESNTVRQYWVSRLAGPRIGRVRVERGEELRMTEHQARGLLAAGELVSDRSLVDDPWGEAAAAATARAKAEADATEAEAAADAARAKLAGDPPPAPLAEAPGHDAGDAPLHPDPAH